ncbi:hypothetical protein [Dietzia natronolimnaea]|uniref:hypothetical protein n=1 Tax=Dietzia natronolimnaea TaxID=161920 RepID=UPI0015F8F5D2|nr:hypothetical protein [Dietzia natronolimnaea]MBB1037359.1 hypothetical protein [Dietzia natronolimnaea]
MDHWDFMDDRTKRSIEQAADQMAPLLNDPAIADLAKWTAPPGLLDGALAAINRDTASVMETALAGSKIHNQFINDRIAASARVGLKDLFPGPGEMSRLGANLDLVFKTPTVADYLAKTGASSIIGFHGPTIAEMMGTRIDTKSLMGLSGLSETAGTIADQWRLANHSPLFGARGALDEFKKSFDLQQSVQSSALASNLLASSGVLRDANISVLAGIELDRRYATIVEQLIQEDEAVAVVATELEQNLVDRFNISQSMAHKAVRVLIWITIAGMMIGITKGIPVLGEIIGTILELTEIYSAKKISKYAAQKIIPVREGKGE